MAEADMASGGTGGKQRSLGVGSGGAGRDGSARAGNWAIEWTGLLMSVGPSFVWPVLVLNCRRVVFAVCLRLRRPLTNSAISLDFVAARRSYEGPTPLRLHAQDALFKNSHDFLKQ